MTFFLGVKRRRKTTLYFLFEHKYTGHCDAVGLQKPYELFFMLFSLSAKILDVVMLFLGLHVAQLPRREFIQWLKFQVLADEELAKLVRELDKQFSDMS